MEKRGRNRKHLRHDESQYATEREKDCVKGQECNEKDSSGVALQLRRELHVRA